MKVYITYDRYEHNEWFNVYYLSTDRNESYTHCIEEDLPSFLEYGPDDCHMFQLVEVEMTKKMYDMVKNWVDTIGGCDGSEDDIGFYDFMCDLYSGEEEYSEVTSCILSTDGCSDHYEIVRYYSVFYKNREVEEVSDHDWLFTDEYEDYYEELTSDEDLCTKVIKEYVRDTY